LVVDWWLKSEWLTDKLQRLPTPIHGRVVMLGTG
jgi:hypothetical protein